MNNHAQTTVLADFLRFFIYEMLNDGIGETNGDHHMHDFFAALVQEISAM